MDAKENLSILLKKNGLKVTSFRTSLLQIMQNSGVAISNENIRKAMPDIDRVTLYRTLETLMEKGVIHKAYEEKNEVYYAICETDCGISGHVHNHLHFKCDRCGDVTCEPVAATPTIQLRHHIINSVSIQVTGVCPSCEKS